MGFAAVRAQTTAQPPSLMLAQVWRSGKGDRAIGWLTHAARLFREQDMDCSSAHIIEASRLATSLAALRERPRPGLGGAWGTPGWRPRRRSRCTP